MRLICYVCKPPDLEANPCFQTELCECSGDDHTTSPRPCQTLSVWAGRGVWNRKRVQRDQDRKGELLRENHTAIREKCDVCVHW